MTPYELKIYRVQSNTCDPGRTDELLHKISKGEVRGAVKRLHYYDLAWSYMLEGYIAATLPWKGLRVCVPL